MLILCAGHCAQHFSIIIPFISYDRYIQYLLLQARGQNYSSKGKSNQSLVFAIEVCKFTQPHPLVYLMSVTAFTLQRQRWVAATETRWPGKTLYNLLKSKSPFYYQALYRKRLANPVIPTSTKEKWGLKRLFSLDKIRLGTNHSYEYSNHKYSKSPSVISPTLWFKTKLFCLDFGPAYSIVKMLNSKKYECWNNT